MKRLLELLSQTIRLKYFYFGVACNMAAYVLSAISKSLPSGSLGSAASSMVGSFLGIASIFFGLRIIFHFRSKAAAWPQATYGTLVSAGILLILKLFGIFLLLLVPAVIFAVGSGLFGQSLSKGANLNDLPVLNTILLVLLTLATVVVVYAISWGSATLTIARGSSKGAIKGSLLAFILIWAETLMISALQIIPGLLALPFHMVSEISPVAKLVAQGVELSFIPYTFALAYAGYFYLTELLVKRDSTVFQNVEITDYRGHSSPQAPAQSADHSNTSDA